MRMANHFRPGTPLFIRVLSSRSLRAITAYVLFARFTFKAIVPGTIYIAYGWIDRVFFHAWFIKHLVTIALTHVQCARLQRRW